MPASITPSASSLREIHQQIASYLTNPTSTSTTSKEDLLRLLDPYINRPSLTSLLLELLKLIAYFADLPSALALSRVSRLFSTLTEGRIWRDLDLTPSTSGAARLKEQTAAVGDGWIEVSGERVHPIRQEVKKKVAMIGERLDRRRMRMVEEVKISRIEGSYHRTAVLLEDLSPNLKALILVHGNKAAPEAANADPSIDVVLLKYSMEAEKCGPSLHFPALVEVWIGSGAIDSISFVAKLCAWAPNLLSLGITTPKDNPLNFASDNHRRLSTPTKIRRMYLRHGYTPYSDNYNPEAFEMALDLLRNSPLLERLDVAYAGRDESILASLMSEISKLVHLQDLRWPSSSLGVYTGGDLEDEEYQDHAASSSEEVSNEPARNVEAKPEMDESDGEEDEAVFTDEEGNSTSSSGTEGSVYGYPALEPDYGIFMPHLSLRRLVMDYNHWATPGYYQARLPPIPNIELLCFTSYLPIQLAFTSAALPIGGIFADWIRTAPKLDSMLFAYNLYGAEAFAADEVSRYLDTIQLQRAAVATVSSLRHGVGELVRIRISVQDVDVKDERFYATQRILRRRFIQTSTLQSQIEGMRGVLKQHEPSFQYWNDFEGAVVPLEVISRMREIEGASEMDWERRGVEVGDVAWQVLLDWRDGLLVM